MPLRSLTLGGDAALQACLVKDAAHVVPGSRGAHVGKIQKVLLLLEKADIQAAELRSRVYGPTTTAAMLNFKRKRQIINRAYQTQADNVVGKMTIARLDEEMIELESQQTPNRTACGGGGAGGPTEAAFAVADVAAPRFKNHGKVLSFVWQETEGAVEFGGSTRHAFHFVNRARELMAPHGLDFVVGDSAPFARTVGPVVPDFEKVLTGSPASCFSVRAAAERVMVTNPKTLRVICCPFSDADERFNGVTDGGSLGDWNFPKFCLLNVRKLNPDHGTLLHEMIHAAGVPLPHDSDPRSVYAEAQVSRDKLQVEHAAKLADAFFASPGRSRRPCGRRSRARKKPARRIARQAGFGFFGRSIRLRQTRARRSRP